MSPPQTLTITNDGEAALGITGLSFTGADPGDYAITSSTCMGLVAAGESCRLTVAFAPQAQGASAATLVVTSTDFANGPQRVSLSGTDGSLPGACRAQPARSSLSPAT